jgi:S-adenosylmethionine:tRNA ribosyltransferase-isomerase
VDTADFDYELPEARIAQRPVEPRDSARLLVDLGPAADTIAEPGVEHVRVHDLVDQLDPGDVVVVNTTRVMPARLHLVKQTGGAAEVLLLERREGDARSGTWEALVRPGKRLRPGTTLTDRTGGGVLQVVVGDDIGEGVRLVRLEAGGGDLSEAIERVGEIPLPPYITTPLGDPDRYQTVYSDLAHPDSSAAPTAGLHITPEVLEVMSARGVAVVDVELVVGLGTFRPIEVDRVEDHHMHRERYRVPRSTLDACDRAHDRGGRVVAVGTTAVRALESAAATGRLEGHTELFIREGFAFRVVDRLLTNFHLPRSSLLVMVDAFAGPRWRELYQAALAGDYRFLSFGDAMLLTRVDRWSEPTEDHRP